MSNYTSPTRDDPSKFRRGADKVSRIPIKVQPTTKPMRKPSWIRAKAHTSPRVQEIKKLMREHDLHSVCEEAQCPNLGECFSHGTATFMIMGGICTRRCPFCDVANGRPDALDEAEPLKLAETIQLMKLSYVVITSVDRDDLRDGGAAHYARCVSEARRLNPDLKIEILVPDFRGRMEIALENLAVSPADVLNHNMETVSRLYKQCRPGADYAWSLRLLQEHKKLFPDVPTKSGLMVGLGEEMSEIEEVMRDLRAHDCDMLTIGQYLQPSLQHHPVDRFVTPDEFKHLEILGYELGFSNVASGPMVRSSYHADMQAKDVVNAT